MANLLKQADSVRAKIVILRASIERDEAMLDLYADDKWAAFTEKIIQPEIVRLAKARMELPFDDKDNHILISGQYIEACKLARGKEQLQSDIDENTKYLYELDKKQLEVNNKINKIKE